MPMLQLVGMHMSSSLRHSLFAIGTVLLFAAALFTAQPKTADALCFWPLNCSQEGNDAEGWLDVANCSIIAGWAWDRDRLDQPVLVSLYYGAPDASGRFRHQLFAVVYADKFREGLGYHGFEVPTPSYLKNNTTYSIIGTAHNIGGTGGETRNLFGVPKFIQCPPPASLSINAAPPSVPYGGSSTITWTAQNATNCSVSGPNISSSAPSGSQSTGALTTNATYRLSCTEGTVSANVSVGPQPCTSAPNSCGMTTSGSVVGGTCTAQPVPDSACPPPPLPSTCSGSACGLECSPDSVYEGGSTTCTWSCNPDTYATALGDGFSTGGQISGSVEVTLTQETRYGLTCVAPDGQRTTDSEIVQVGEPELSLVATPSPVRRGNSTTVNWSAQNVEENSCSLTSSAGVSATGNSGSRTITINSQVTVTLTCTTPAGPTSTSILVNVLPTVEEI